MRLRAAAMAASIAVGLLATPASAATKLFRLFGDADGSFTLPASPTSPPATSDYFAIYDTVAVLNGSSGGFDLYFYLAASGGGFDIQSVADPDVLLQLAGDQLFSGTAFAPTFINGTYDLVELNSQSGDYKLVISDIPEPASWAMLIAGFGLTGAMMRRRRIAAGSPGDAGHEPQSV